MRDCWPKVNWQLILIRIITTSAISPFIADVTILTDKDNGKFLEECELKEEEEGGMRK